jgi:predicted esterase YcpF (UPF0227 family)
MALNAIIYFHGYNSTGNSRTSTIIRDSYPNYDIISPTYNTKDAYLGVKELTPTIEDTIRNYDNVYLVGSSLGGFMANYFSNKYSLPVVLVNPCLDPVISLVKYPISDRINIESYINYYLEDGDGISKVVVLGREDDIIKFDTYMDRFLNRYKIFINDNMGHRVSSKDDIVPAIDYLLT